MKKWNNLWVISIVAIGVFNSCSNKTENENGNAQTFLGSGDSLFAIGAVEESISQYRKAYDIDSMEDIAYKLAKSYSIIQKIDSSFYYLDIAVHNDSSVYRLFQGEYYPLQKYLEWDQIVYNQIEKYSEKYELIKNKDLAAKMFNIKVSDQAFYYQISKYPDSSEYYWSLKKKINETNLREFEEILAIYGWPRRTDIGLESSYVSSALILHSGEIDKMKRYLPFLEESVKQGGSDRSELALVLDKLSMMEGKDQLFGSQLSYDSVEHVYYIGHIIDSENLNKRRSDMGLEPIEHYLERWEGVELRLSE